MLIFKKKEALTRHSNRIKKEGKRVGFVPTMGALHAGHVSLIEEAKKNCEEVMCSIFVNPTQFNNKADLNNYPRDIETDIEILEKAGCDVVFLPEVSAMYPVGEDDLLEVDLEGLDKIMEGEHRPGHFQGVVTIVDRLFSLVTPDMAFFGEKDYQQLLIIKKMVEKRGYSIKIEGCPIIREPDGLAMSSRNTLLTPLEREKATFLYESLCWVRDKCSEGQPTQELLETIEKRFCAHPLFKLDYFQISSEVSLKKETTITKYSRAFIAAFIGNVRLIDNMPLNV